MTSLIVALDAPVPRSMDLYHDLRKTGAAFKVGISTLLDPVGMNLIRTIVSDGNRLMVDAKIYDTRDTVLRIMDRAERLGAYMVTVHEDCVAAALEGRRAAAIISVRTLTDGTGDGTPRMFMASEIAADGLVCSVTFAGALRRHTDKLLVCPGIRPAGTAAHNHQLPATPRQAHDAGADYIVVGRPIYQAADPVAAARAIIREIESAIDSPGREG